MSESRRASAPHWPSVCSVRPETELVLAGARTLRSLGRRTASAGLVAVLLAVVFGSALRAHAQDTDSAAPAGGASAPANETVPAEPAPAPQPPAQPLMNRSYTEIRTVNGVAVQPPNANDRSTAARVIREGTIPDVDRAVFEAYIRFTIAEFTWQSNLDQLPRKRDEIKKRILVQSGRAESSDAHDYINETMLREFMAIATNDEYHPAARLNAILMIGNLDQTEPDLQGRNSVPLAAALPALMQTLRDPKQLEAVRVATLVGILRHAQTNPTGLGRPIVEELAAMAVASEPPQGISTAGHNWLRRRVAQILSTLATARSSDLSPASLTAAIKLVDDTQASLLTRCDAAMVLAAVSKTQLDAARINPLDTAFSLTRLVGDIGREAGNDRLVVPAESLAYYLSAIRLALVGNDPSVGLQNAATGEASKTMVELVARVDEMLRVATQRSSDESAVRHQISIRAAELETWAKSKQGQPSVATAGSATGS